MKKTLISLRMPMLIAIAFLILLASFYDIVTAMQVYPFFAYGLLAVASFYGKKVAVPMVGLALIMFLINLETSIVDVFIWAIISILYIGDN